MFMIAFIQFSVGPTIPLIATRFGVPETALGIAFAFQFSGALVTLLLGRTLIRRFGYAANLFAFTLLYVAASMILPFSTSLWQVCAALFVLGAASANAQVIIFALVELLYGDQGNRFQNLVGSAFAFGAVTGPLFTGLTGAAISWGTVFWTGAAIGLVVLPWLRRSPVQPSESETPTRESSGTGTWFWVLSLALVSYLAAESIINSWLSTYLKEWLRAGSVWQGLSLSVFWIGVAGGRLLSSRVSGKLGLAKVVAYSGLLAILVFAVAVQAQTVTSAIILFGLTGASLGSIAPSLISLLAQQPGGASKLHLYFAIGQSGPILYPFVAGRIAEVAGFYYALLLLIPALIAMLGFITVYERVVKPAQST